MAKMSSIFLLAKRIRQHPRARRGASLPLVLLLFLVCAMASSIVLAAGTAAAGRAAGLEESDKAYYDVTSSARAFRDELNAKPHTVTIALSKLGATDAPALTILLDGKEISEADQKNFSILEQAAFFALFGNFRNQPGVEEEAKKVSSYDSADAFLNTAAFFNWDASNAHSDWNTWLGNFDGCFPNKDFGTFGLSYKDTNDSNKNFDFDVCVRVDSEGNLVFKFREKGKTEEKDNLLLLTCSGDYSTQEVVMQNGMTVKAVTVNWTPADIGKA